MDLKIHTVWNDPLSSKPLFVLCSNEWTYERHTRQVTIMCVMFSDDIILVGENL
jgi:hypothetical protein